MISQTIKIFMSKNKKTNDKKKQGPDPRAVLTSAIRKLIDQSAGKEISFKYIIKKLTLKKKDDIKMAGQIFDQLEEDGLLKPSENGWYTGNESTAEALTGVVDHVSSRFAYVRLGKDIPD